jgi:cytochrome c peroxidase
VTITSGKQRKLKMFEIFVTKQGMHMQLVRSAFLWGSLVMGFASASAADLSAKNLQKTSQGLFGIVKPVAAEEVETPQAVLGRALFWDERLSLNGKVACASCHTAANWSGSHLPFDTNAKGVLTTLHSQTIFMAAEQPYLRWYGDRTSPAHQAERSLTGSMGFAKADEVLPILKAFGYADLFKKAYPEQEESVSTANYASAIQAYERTLRTPATFDRFIAGDTKALNKQQVTGLNKFVAFGCVGCHSGPLLGGSGFQKFGVTKDYWLETGSAKPDLGRFVATKKEEDKYVFRTAMLRNISKTAPYFHDGSVAKIEEAIRIMGELQLGRKLSPKDIADIAAFFESLTGAVPAHYAAPVFPVAITN